MSIVFIPPHHCHSERTFRSQMTSGPFASLQRYQVAPPAAAPVMTCSSVARKNDKFSTQDVVWGSDPKCTAAVVRT